MAAEAKSRFESYAAKVCAQAADFETDLSASLLTPWDVEPEASKAEEANILAQQVALTGKREEKEDGEDEQPSSHATLFETLRPDIVDILKNRRFENHLLLPFGKPGDAVVEFNFSWVFGKNDGKGEVSCADPVWENGQLKFDVEDKMFAVIFPAKFALGKENEVAVLASFNGPVELKYLPYAMAYVLPIKTAIEAIGNDEIVHQDHTGKLWTLQEALQKLQDLQFYFPGSNVVDPSKGAGFPFLTAIMDKFLGLDVSAPLPTKYAARKTVHCMSGETRVDTSLMEKVYPFAKPGPPTSDIYGSFVWEIKRHLVINGMAPGLCNRAIWGNFGAWDVQLPCDAAQFDLAWDCWCKDGPEVSIAWGMPGPKQTKLCWYQDNLHIVPSFPVSFAANYTKKLQSLYAGGHIAKGAQEVLQKGLGFQSAQS